MIDYESAMEKGIEIAKKSGSEFFRKNAAAYTRLGFDEQDVIGYLYEEVLCKKYLPLIEEKPDTYETIENFKSSFWTACHHRLLVHANAHINSQKRGDILRAGSIELDADYAYSRHACGGPGESTFAHETTHELSITAKPSYLNRVKALIDQCDDQDVWRALALMAYGKVNSKTELFRVFKYSRNKFEQVWSALVTYLRECFEFGSNNGPQLAFAS